MNRGTAAGGGLLLVSAGLLAFLGTWEGENQHTVYADHLAGGLPTVCRGLTRHVTDTPIVVGEVWSESQCHQEETRAIERVQIALIGCFDAVPPQSVFDAASSHAWNFGWPATCNSVAMQYWRQGDWQTGCERIAHADDGRRVWSYVRTGKIIDGRPEYRFVQGLANRRDDEVLMCLSDVVPDPSDSVTDRQPTVAVQCPWWRRWWPWRAEC